MLVRLRLRALILTLAATFGLLSLTTFVTSAHADGTPNITGTINSPTILHGETVPVSFEVRNPAGQPYGYNLSFRVVLPAGVTYSGGAAQAPTTVAGPGVGETTLIFSNVADLSPNASNTLAFDVDYDVALYDVGSRFEISAQAFLNDQPRYIPRFDGAGLPVGPSATSYTGYTPVLRGVTTINAIEIEKDEPSWEGEIMRGVHDHQTVYTVTVRNNGIRPTNGVRVVDYVPAGLEFLGCGGPGSDNTRNAPTNPGSAEEYPGKGPIVVPALAPCDVPTVVDTVNVDPDGAGPLPRAVYTRVEWTIGMLASRSSYELRYRAAIPIRENTMTWSGATPARTGAQGTNLDNNNGPETRDEQELTNYATASGSYNGTLAVSDETWLTRTAEDWVVHKEGSDPALVQGALTIWTLTFQTSEYRSVRNGVVTDTLPSGLCPIGVRNFTTQNDAPDAQCDPIAGQNPTMPYTSVTENADGTFTITWDQGDFPQLAQTNVSQTFTLRFPTVTRTHYQRNFLPTTPILTRDTVENRVTTDADSIVRCLAPGTPDCTTPGPEINHDAGYGTGTSLPDASQASQLAARPDIFKLVAQSGTDCSIATYVRTVPVYHPGDRVCWQLHVNFPVGVDTSPQVIRDFLPSGARYERGSDSVHGPNDVSATIDDSLSDSDSVLGWTVGGGTVPRGSRIFERVISTIVGPSVDDPNQDILGNLMKFSAENTARVSEPLRDRREFRLELPEVDLVKGVARVERGGSQVLGPFAADRDHRMVQAGDRVTYRVDVTNSGGQDAEQVRVWDVLPIRDYDCTFVVAPGAVCVDGGLGVADHIEWTVPLIAAGTTTTLEYSVIVPLDIGPSRQLDNRAGVRDFAGRTNLNTLYPYTPANNIDPTHPEAARPNAPAADDVSDVYTADATVAKRVTTPIDSAADGNTAAQATIGERVDYTVTVTIPAGTTLHGDGFVADTLDSATRQPYVAGSGRLAVAGPITLADVVLDEPAGSAPGIRIRRDFVVPPSGPDAVVTLTFSTLVADVAGNSRTAADINNRATLRWTDPTEGAQTQNSALVRTTLVEPVIRQAKSDDRNPDRVIPGEIVEYTLTTTNDNSGGRVSTAHDVTLVDTVPVGVTPIDVAPGNAPLADGATVPGSGGAVWNSGARTITKTVATLLPGARTSFRYRVSVDDPAIGGAELTNRVVTRTASLPSSEGGRRTSGTGYEARAEDTIRIQGASVAKTVSPLRATVGEHVTYDVLVTIPADVSLYDVTVTDLLPDTIAFDRYGAVTPVSGPAIVNRVEFYDAVRNGDGTTTVAWDFGDLVAPLSTPQVVRLTYSGHVLARDRTNADVVAGDTAVNSVTVGSNRSDRVGPFDRTTIPTTFEDDSPPSRATVTVIEPRVSIDKQVRVGSGSFEDGPATAQSDDPLTYQLTIRNSGDGPAHDIVVTDEPDAELTDVRLDTLPPGVTVTKAWSAGDRRIELAIAGPIAPAGDVVITYTARLVAASGLSDGQAIDNTAAVPHYFGLSESERTDPGNAGITYRDYTDGGDDSTRVVLDFPTLTLVKTTGLASFPDRGDAEVGQPFPWRVTVRNTSTTATASDVVVTDTLPENWAYAASSATLTPGGASEPTVTRNAAGDRLAWTIASIAPGATVTIDYRATPAVAAARSPGLGADAHVNSALVSSARDEAGNSGNADGDYGTPADDARATLLVPALAISKTPDNGAAVAGEESTFSIEVENSGSVDARNVVVTDVLPRGLSYDATNRRATAAPATGFTERSVTAGPGAGETTIVWNVAQLDAGARVTITVPARVAADVADGTTLTNNASAVSDEVPDPVRDDGSLDVGAETDLAVNKSGPGTYLPGGRYTWSVRVRNLGPSDAQAVELTDALPAGTRFSSADAPCTEAAGVVRCALGTVPVGYDRTFAITVTVDPAMTTTLTNTAFVSTTTTDTDNGNDSASHGPTAAPIADVTIVKTATPPAIPRGGQSTFTLTITNLGPSVAEDVRVTDALPAGLEFVSVDDTDCSELAGVVSCAFGDLAVNAPIRVQIVVRGNVEGAFTNSATVTTRTPQPAGGGEPDTGRATVTVGPVADLAIEKSGPATVAAGGQATWQLRVTNNGPDDATGVTVTDTLPAGTTFVTASSGCTAAGQTVTCALADLAVGASTTVEVTATVPYALGSATIVNSATVRGDKIDSDPSNDSDEASTVVGPSTDLAIVKSGPATATAGGTITWTLIATNNGPSTATGVTVSDALPAGVGFVSATPTQGACTPNGQTVGCALGELPSGGSAQIQLVGQVGAGLANTTVVNIATVTGEQPDPNPANDRGEAATQIVPPPPAPPVPPAEQGFDLAIVKRVSGGGRAAVGGTLGYTLRVTNAGPGSATGVTVTDTLPRGLDPLRASVAGGSCTVRGQLVRCALGTLAAGQSRTISLRVRVLASGTIRNTATVAAHRADLNPRNDSSTVPVTVPVPRATLSIEKRALGRGAVRRGGAVRFRVTVRNTSASAATGVTVCDRLPEGLSLLSTGGGRLRDGDLCWNAGLLAGRATRTFTFRARVLADVRGPRIVNVASVTAENAARRQARAAIRLSGPIGGVLPAAGRGGGVTG
ncbi:hypothetical protein VSS74_25515 [Conexibacter stalactiti]|uniref:DUF11 domain-containing protein n=1 Tax=Conexibacter stalactiti TaxID=1940611 RepID=A0ABU4HWM8_9ACTN|nr:hypothetical protein [Conexibacter stalactiti]MDW5597736.1 hypothetical protein [Conexibacter stalactiti]MEC5038378.1 hypothetical protein [Conexibacter stalactiti]